MEKQTFSATFTAVCNVCKKPVSECPMEAVIKTQEAELHVFLESEMKRLDSLRRTFIIFFFASIINFVLLLAYALTR